MRYTRLLAWLTSIFAKDDLIEKHLEDGADIEEAEDSFNGTALHAAAWFNKTFSVKCLLDHGANIEAKNTFGRTALFLVAWKGHKSTVDTLLDRGAYIEAKDRCGGYTALLRLRRQVTNLSSSLYLIGERRLKRKVLLAKQLS